MSLPNKGLARRVAHGAFVAALMSGAATAALAAPTHKTHAHKAHAAVDARDAKLEALQQQINEMRAQMAQMQQPRTDTQAEAHVAALQQQLDTVNQQLADVKAAQTADASDIITLKTPSGATTIPSLPNGKPSFATADGRFTANVRAIVMLDTAKYLQKGNLPSAVTNRDLNDGTNFRRARFGIDGKLFKDFDYALIYEFGGSGAEDAGHIQEAWAQYTAFKPWRIKIGAFEPNIGLAAAVSTSQMPMMERPGPAEVARNVAAGDTRSALQVTGNGLWGEGDAGIATRWFASAAITGNTVGVINSTGSATAQPNDEQTGVIGRLAIAPFSSTNWQAHLGVNAQLATQPNDAGSAANPRYPIQLRDRPELRVDGTRLVDTGAIDAKTASVYGAEAGLSVQNFLIESEYFKYKIDRRLTGTTPLRNPDFSGWYVQGVWVLTGENRPYNPAEGRFDAPKQNYNFNPAAGAWGAFELAARYSDLDLNYNAGSAGTAAAPDAIRGGEQKISSVGLNWYLNPDIRFMFDYLHVDVNRFNAAGVQVGQSYNALALRSQLTF
ncbi:porin [Phenylobacterium hankyongense]|uniref:Porin n=1 Tax=Phenylobacterium hankyongense TaxID=1813876 RepID=A0A328B2K8_9CAUL|nr:porin [Phenylobacterium hankyongense]RAK59248.1 porin [Phenylobacterium hankyongense]